MASARPTLPGAHRVIKRHSNGRTTIYWYRTRGGCSLLRFSGATRAEALAEERKGFSELIAAYTAASTRPSLTSVSNLKDLVQHYRGSHRYAKLGMTTKRNWATHLDRISQELGTMPLDLMHTHAARAALQKWHDRRASNARTAQYGIQVLKRLLSIAVDQGWASANPATRVETDYKGRTHADVIVEDHELAAIIQASTPHAALIIAMLAETGLRRGDVVDLRWAEVRGASILKRTSKSRGRTSVLVELTQAAQTIIATLRSARDDAVARGEIVSDFVFTTSKGERWKPDSVTQAFNRARAKAGVAKRLHDLRGTAATKLRVAGRSLPEIAEILGWSERKVGAIAKHYIDDDLVNEARLAASEQHSRGAA